MKRNEEIGLFTKPSKMIKLANGVIVQVREGRRKGYVSLCDLEVTSRKNRNFWPVREYAVWFANQ